MRPLSRKFGFTLVEISIVLIIVGLVTGAILVGNDLIEIAKLRTTIAQIEKYNTAINTFRGKYGALPGDIADPQAQAFGFKPRGPHGGQGDGDGLIEGNSGNSAVTESEERAISGEGPMVWVDLSTANLIEGGFIAAVPDVVPGVLIGTAMDAYFPLAKVDRSHFYTYSTRGVNRIALAASQGIGGGMLVSTTSLTVNQAYAIDSKADDGYPQAGKTVALHIDVSIRWANGPLTDLPYTTATPASSTSCFDNGNVDGATQLYSLGQNRGNNVTCALSARFQ